ncbi:peptidase inhibitor family I36 protein [Thermomonospora umbrina]|uniref:peptidase inhibitor family I36 protein n=1 Tax=Thermomonospora umbrina TaxID=111806 RepID=UPI00147710E7|nr:peptidase inhibitor family I36 protein [Thermomonospora umbrina]
MRTLSDCVNGWLCVWEWPEYSGAARSFRGTGVYNLGDIGWRDRISSIWNRTNVTVVTFDSRTYPVRDRVLYVDPSEAYRDLSHEPHDGGGSWNNKIDKIGI